MLRYCVRCVVPRTTPHLRFDDVGGCRACRSSSPAVADAVPITLIASAGADNYRRMNNAANSGAGAVAADSIFHPIDQTPAEGEKALHATAISVRRNYLAI